MSGILFQSLWNNHYIELATNLFEGFIKVFVMVSPRPGFAHPPGTNNSSWNVQAQSYDISQYMKQAVLSEQTKGTGISIG